MKTSIQHIINAASVGVIASRIFSEDQIAHVAGTTSKGLFIKTGSKWLVFISFDYSRGPLTIALDEYHPFFQSVSGGDLLNINSGNIFLTDHDIMININNSEVWRPPTPSVSPHSDAERQKNLVYLAEKIISDRPNAGLSYLLPPLLGLPEACPPHPIIGNIDWEFIQQLKIGIRDRKPLRLSGLVSSILGYGPGLTPSADDFCVGLLLTLNRWQRLKWTAGSLQKLNLRLVESAYKKTTTLSANLIECATLGLANEKLTNALDWIMTGKANNPQIATNLLEWGNSSGIDAFVGMAVSLTA